jgi:hypothetical protein
MTQAGQSTSVNTYMNSQGKLKQVTSKMTLNCLLVVIHFIGEDTLGYKMNEIRMHSVQSGWICNGHVLGRNTLFTIMLIGLTLVQ